MDRRNHPVEEKKYEKQEINGNYRVPLYVCVGFVRLWFYGRKEQVQHAAETQTAEAEPDTSLEDGEYTVNVELEGGSGRASVDSEAKVKVTDGQAYATIVWSSTYYDYMLVDGKNIQMRTRAGIQRLHFQLPEFRVRWM